VGDSAIWLGEVRYLRSIGIRISYACHGGALSRHDLAARIGDGTILLHGGGNLGDLWPVHQLFREAVIAACPRNRIIQLPQTIHFLDRKNLDRARSVLDAHPGLTLLVRDQASLDVAQKEFRAPSLLCPDMAFAMGPQGMGERPTCAVVWLRRTDIESRETEAQGQGLAGIEVLDWLYEEPTVAIQLSDWLDWQIARHPRLLAPLARARPVMYASVAAHRVRIGMRLLSRGRAVVTDRLHGHILSLLLGIPHVLLDNSYGKLRRFYETWTRECPLVHWATSPREALETARAISGKCP
jgi:pyruvyl transferase EpsO